MTRTDFSKNLRARRAEAGFRSARDFADAIGINENRYSRYERGTSEPNLELLCKIAARLQVTPNSLLGFEEAQPAHGSGAVGFSEAATGRIDTQSSSDYSRTRASGQSTSYGSELTDILCWRFADAYVRLSAARAKTGASEARNSEAEHLTQVAKLFSLIKTDGLSAMARLLLSADFVSAPKNTGATARQAADALLAHLLNAHSEANSETHRRV